MGRRGLDAPCIYHTDSEASGNMSGPVTAQDLLDAQARVDAHPRDRAERDALVQQALAEDWTERAIAAVTGLTHSRIHQIKEGTR